MHQFTTKNTIRQVDCGNYVLPVMDSVFPCFADSVIEKMEAEEEQAQDIEDGKNRVEAMENELNWFPAIVDAEHQSNTVADPRRLVFDELTEDELQLKSLAHLQLKKAKLREKIAVLESGESWKGGTR